MRTAMRLPFSLRRQVAAEVCRPWRGWWALIRAGVAALLLAAVALPVLAGNSAMGAGELIGGSFRVAAPAGGNAPVAGVKVSAASADGMPVGLAVSGPDGRFQIEVPGPGTYALTVDLRTLPAGVVLRSGRPERLTVNVLEGQQMTVLFPLDSQTAPARQPTQAGAESAAGPTLVGKIAQLGFDGLVFGMILAVAAVGWSLIYRVSGVVNFAHGEMLSLAAVLAFALSAAESGPHLPLVLAAVIAVVAIAALGGALEVGLFRRLTAKAQEHFAILVFTIGLSFMLRYLLLYLFGANSHPYNEYALQEQIRSDPSLRLRATCGSLASRA